VLNTKLTYIQVMYERRYTTLSKQETTFFFTTNYSATQPINYGKPFSGYRPRQLETTIPMFRRSALSAPSGIFFFLATQFSETSHCRPPIDVACSPGILHNLILVKPASLKPK